MLKQAVKGLFERSTETPYAFMYIEADIIYNMEVMSWNLDFFHVK